MSDHRPAAVSNDSWWLCFVSNTPAFENKASLKRFRQTLVCLSFLIKCLITCRQKFAWKIPTHHAESSVYIVLASMQVVEKWKKSIVSGCLGSSPHSESQILRNSVYVRVPVKCSFLGLRKIWQTTKIKMPFLAYHDRRSMFVWIYRYYARNCENSVKLLLLHVTWFYPWLLARLLTANECIHRAPSFKYFKDKTTANNVRRENHTSKDTLLSLTLLWVVSVKYCWHQWAFLV